MKTIKLVLHGERALFRNISIPGADVAESLSLDTPEQKNRAERAILGIIGTMLGKWRNLDIPPSEGNGYAKLSSELSAWRDKSRLSMTELEYKFNEVITLGQHRYKNVDGFLKSGESGPKDLVYHWNVMISIKLELEDFAAEELETATHAPVGIPYLGQSNCPAQVSVSCF